MNVARALQSAFTADKRRDLMFMRWLRTVPIIGGTLHGQRGPEGPIKDMYRPMVTGYNGLEPRWLNEHYVRDGDVWRYDRTLDRDGVEAGKRLAARLTEQGSITVTGRYRIERDGPELFIPPKR